MRAAAAGTLARHQAGEVDFIDAVTFFFDSGPMSFFFGGVGQFEWIDATIGTQIFYGMGSLMTLDVPETALTNQATPITVRLAETYLPEGSATPVNVFDDGVRATIDEEDWQNQTAVVSCFWIAKNGDILEREQVAVRVIDDMPTQRDDRGVPYRIAILERPDITQRDIEGHTRNGEFQKLIDATDKSLEHVSVTTTQNITFGKRQPGPVV